MKNQALAADYIRRATIRLRAIDVLFEGESWADVVRESQEVVELALKALLRACGVEAPRIHDVSDVLLAERARLPAALHADFQIEYLPSHIIRTATANHVLRKHARLGGGQQRRRIEHEDPVAIAPARFGDEARHGESSTMSREASIPRALAERT